MSVTGKQTGNPVLLLKNGLKLYNIWFPIRLKGLLIGNRIIQAAERGFCFEPISRIVCELFLDAEIEGNNYEFFSYGNSTKDMYTPIIGGIYKVN